MCCLCFIFSPSCYVFFLYKTNKANVSFLDLKTGYKLWRFIILEAFYWLSNIEKMVAAFLQPVMPCPDHLCSTPALSVPKAFIFQYKVSLLDKAFVAHHERFFYKCYPRLSFFYVTGSGFEVVTTFSWRKHFDGTQEQFQKLCSCSKSMFSAKRPPPPFFFF